MKARRETLVGGWLRVFLLVGLVSGFPASAAGALAVQTIPRESVRWHYERALVLDAQGHTGRAIAALYRALDAAEEQRHALEVAIKAKLTETDRMALEQLERTARDRRLAGSSRQQQTQVELAQAFDQLAARHLSAADLGLWQTLAVQVTECRYFLARLYWRSERTADAIMTLVQVMDVPAMPEHILARLLLARAYGQLGAWEYAQPHLERLAALTDLQDPAARRALERLRKAVAQPKSSDPSSARADLQAVVTAIEQAFLSSPAAYRALTLGRHLHDPLAYLELAHLCEEEDTPEELRATLQEGIRVRGNFFPVAWLALGAEAEQQAAELEAANQAAEAQQAYRRAAEAFATAFEQLQQLDFQPVRDFDPERLTTLRRKLAQRQEQP
ncbi:lipopolysaccharide assembly protein LapB [Chloracidobacterium aggregatum]|uniref:Tetratricopeptide repeat protein n=1 Tax=Chloracidobacterium sp. N TaxID=2821540 RepID=A0ABX8AX04_9BACT|nr:hypothetical protein [Chloracidobacterium aggregatum]QUV84409.1 hypothetical protein J8C03_09750 [Chloracidobacterium sp. 2]QUV87106.1 hypothetical protein J8C07_07860 [Chloracidobacterium sp. S]QUV90008.1 hypothetical protein J8C04_06880 [Chloracidobacterium sp. A]QUV93218.1 hypothetical protein J8C05_07480 [Chloracidobacterium sp. N]QUV96373.1 hypothetical protein J8C00_08615 [Chloracidobacterium sp. E]